MRFNHFHFYDRDAQYLVLAADTTDITRDRDVLFVQKYNIKNICLSVYIV